MVDMATAKKAINVNEGGSTMIRKAAKRESPVRISLNRRGGLLLIFNYSLFSFP